jgi:hypothetical protein
VKASALVALSALVLVSAAVAAVSLTPDVTRLIPQATEVVRAKPGFSKAVVVEADGTPVSGTATAAAQITKWRFVYSNVLTPGHKYKSAALFYEDGKFTRFVRYPAIFVGSKLMTSVPKMTLARAIAKLRAAGHKKPFHAVTLREPHQDFDEAIYTFVYDGKDWTVGTKTGKVRPIS